MLSKLETRLGNLILAVVVFALLGVCYLSPYKFTAIEWYGTVFGLTQAVFIMFNKKENWIFFLAYITAFLIMSWEFSLYGDVLENTIYLTMGILGTTAWYKARQNGAEFRIQYATNLSRIVAVSLITVVTIILYFVLIRTDDPTPFLDAITTSIGFVATYYMARKKVEAWILWFVADILMVIQYIVIPQQPIGFIVLTAIWTFMAVASFIKWHKYSKESLTEIS